MRELRQSEKPNGGYHDASRLPPLLHILVSGLRSSAIWRYGIREKITLTAYGSPEPI